KIASLASHINFKFLTVASLNPATGRAFELVYGNSSATPSDISITHCKISGGNVVIYAYNLVKGHHVFSFNTITGSAYGIMLYGWNNQLTTDSNIIEYNTIQNTAAGTGIDFKFTRDLKVRNNKITGGNYGMNANYNYGALEILANKITAANLYG